MREMQKCEKKRHGETRFRSVNNYKALQEIHIDVKSEYVGTLTTIELMTQSRTTSTTTCVNVDANLKHVHTHENNT